MTDIPQWWMKGDWFDVCSCNIACPCEFAQPPPNKQLRSAYYTANLPVLDDQLAKGGVRLARVLDEAFQTAGAAEGAGR